ncbi:MAG: hypothetical protein KAT88_07310, partial [Spirochaetes bacterium]|nr:hypothetical protein [Spirochaetota bacterium]
MAKLFHLCVMISLIPLLVMCSSVPTKDPVSNGSSVLTKDPGSNAGSVFQMDSVKLEHLIKISYGDNTYIFHGF